MWSKAWIRSQNAATFSIAWQTNRSSFRTSTEPTIWTRRDTREPYSAAASGPREGEAAHGEQALRVCGHARVPLHLVPRGRTDLGAPPAVVENGPNRARDSFRVARRRQEHVLSVAQGLRRPQAARPRQDDGTSARHRLQRHALARRLRHVLHRHDHGGRAAKDVTH